MADTSNAHDGPQSARPSSATSVLLVDDESRFRRTLADRLTMKGLEVRDVEDGAEAVRIARMHHPDVVVLDLKMPAMQGDEVLRQIKQVAPEVQVIILTGHASLESATETGRMDAFAYLEKPCETEVLLDTIEAARREKKHALARQDMVQLDSPSLWGWLWGTHNYRPGILILAAVLFMAIYFAPTPESLLQLLEAQKTGDTAVDSIAGYSEYHKMKSGETIAAYYSRYADRGVEEVGPGGALVERALTPREAATNIQVMMGVLCVAALLWATGGLPIGFTALLVGVLMYVFAIFPPNMVAAAYAKDAVLFIAGVLALAAGIIKTGLDRRIGLLLLGISRSPRSFLFLFLPLFAVTASFLSEHALIAFIAPLLMMVYFASTRAAKLTKDRSLAVMLILGVCFAANQGGPGSPAAGGRNAVMIGILADYGAEPTFGEWVKYGLPFVPVMALVIAAYFYVRLGRSIKVKDLNIGGIVRQEAARIGPMTRKEYITAAVLIVVVLLWITASRSLGMGGPALLGLVALAAFRVIGWRDINGISWDVVAMYGAACAMGKGLATTGAAIWMADSFISNLPRFMTSGEGLCIAASLFTGILTNIMSDGATVSAIGPVAVPTAQLSGTHPWMVGFATAFASSFANMFIIGTPNNAIAYTLAKDPESGEQLVTLGDFLKHGFVITVLAFLVLWGWAFFGYWRWMGF